MKKAIVLACMFFAVSCGQGSKSEDSGQLASSPSNQQLYGHQVKLRFLQPLGDMCAVAGGNWAGKADIVVLDQQERDIASYPVNVKFFSAGLCAGWQASAENEFSFDNANGNTVENLLREYGGVQGGFSIGGGAKVYTAFNINNGVSINFSSQTFYAVQIDLSLLSIKIWKDDSRSAKSPWNQTLVLE